MRRILSDQPLRPSELVAIRKLRRHIAKSVRSDFQFKVKLIHLPSGNIVARIVEITVSDDPPVGLICSVCGHRYVDPQTWVCGACGADHNALPDPYHGPERPHEWTPEPEEDTCSMVGCINPCQPGYYFCREHMAAISGMSAEDWAAGLTLGGITPPWEEEVRQADWKSAGLLHKPGEPWPGGAA